MDYSQHYGPGKTPQIEKADPAQVENSAGGFSFAVTKWTRLDRFLILGAEGGSYYATEKKLVRENAKAVEECAAEDAARTVSAIVAVSDAGRAPKNDAAVFALALVACSKDPAARRLALAAVPKVCRIGTHLFQFARAIDSWRGWGRSLRRTVAAWYGAKTAEEFAREVTKYQQRDGWSHRDLLRLCHAKLPVSHQATARWVVAGAEGAGAREVKGSTKSGTKARSYAAVELSPYIQAFAELKTADEARTIALVLEHGFTHEMIDTRHKSSAAVWEALLSKMPMTAMIRNLGKMTEVGLIKPMSAASKLVAERLADAERLKKARVHPIQMLSALMVYQQGHGERGSLKWEAVPRVTEALDAGFYLSFGAVEPTGKRMLLALDVSASMTWGSIAGVPGLTPRTGSAAMAMVTARVESDWHVMGFSHELVKVPITPTQRLDDVVKAIERIPMGGTDCSLPMRWAQEKKVDVDCFSVYTDSETWAGPVHPHEALSEYRRKQVASAKLVVVGMVSSGFTIADPNDAGMLDVVGMDTATPNLIAAFAGGV